MLEAAGFLLEIIGWAIDTIAMSVVGWRFLLSPSYRAATRARWRTASRVGISLDVFGATLGMATSAALVAWLAIVVLR